MTNTELEPLWNKELIEEYFWALRRYNGEHYYFTLEEVQTLGVIISSDYEQHRRQSAAKIAELEQELAETHQRLNEAKQRAFVGESWEDKR